MIARKVTYKGFDGKDVEEIVRLNLTKAEILNLNMKYSDYGGLEGYYRMLLTNIKEGDPSWKPLVSFLQEVILSAYGKKTEDGRFVKKINGVALADEFETSEAYAALLMPLLTEEGFNEIEPLLRGILPADLNDTAVEAEKERVRTELGMIDYADSNYNT